MRKKDINNRAHPAFYLPRFPTTTHTRNSVLICQMAIFHGHPCVNVSKTGPMVLIPITNPFGSIMISLALSVVFPTVLAPYSMISLARYVPTISPPSVSISGHPTEQDSRQVALRTLDLSKFPGSGPNPNLKSIPSG